MFHRRNNSTAVNKDIDCVISLTGSKVFNTKYKHINQKWGNNYKILKSPENSLTIIQSDSPSLTLKGTRYLGNGSRTNKFARIWAMQKVKEEVIHKSIEWTKGLGDEFKHYSRDFHDDQVSKNFDLI